MNSKYIHHASTHFDYRISQVPNHIDEMNDNTYDFLDMVIRVYMVSMTPDFCLHNVWIADMGANTHMTHNVECFHIYE